MPEPIDRISAVLATSPRRWLDLAAALPEVLLGHVFPRRIEEFLAGAEELGGVDPATIPPAEERTARELAEAFALSRQKNLGLLAALGPGDLERTSRSRRLGLISLGDALHQWALHDLDHLVQAERALLQAFVVQSGALRTFYRALDMEAGPVEAPSA